MLMTAAEMASYIYLESEDPEGALSWWLSPCRGTDLVPDEVKKVLGILNSVSDDISSLEKPKNILKGSGKWRFGQPTRPVHAASPKPHFDAQAGLLQRSCLSFVRPRPQGQGRGRPQTLGFGRRPPEQTTNPLPPSPSTNDPSLPQRPGTTRPTRPPTMAFGTTRVGGKPAHPPIREIG
ncbi:hypothetical protein B0I37DRAFT_45437 [Chaetomium sp. MPI-CAGE-AT-0009]|nr:hypothetical protein B0I37DRAFT_45437 [Chaetomium sp. MPI-CAGE-AT-0009]